MVYPPDIPKECIPRNVWYASGDPTESLPGTFVSSGTDCSSYIFGVWLGREFGRSLRFSFAPGVEIPDPRSGAGEYQVSLDGGDWVQLLLSDGVARRKDNGESFVDERMKDFDAAIRESAASLSPSLIEKVSEFRASDSRWSSCMADTIEIVVAEGVVAGAIAAGVVGGPVGVVAGAEAGALLGAAVGLVDGYISC